MRFLIVFPAIFVLSGLFSRYGSAQTKPFTVLAMGDSTTAGTPGFYSPVEKPPKGSGDETSQYAYWILQNHPDWVLLNRGVRGQRTDQILRRFKNDLKTFTPDAAVILAGVNDIYQGYPEEDVMTNLREMYNLALASHAKVVACTILPYDISTAQAREKMKRINEWIRSYAQEQKFLFCDTFLFLSDPANPGHLTGTPDGIHPDVSGYRKMGEVISEVLERASA